MLNTGANTNIITFKGKSVTLDKAFVDIIKKENNEEIENIFYYSNINTQSLIFILKNLGRLNAGFNFDVFIKLLENHNDEIRYWAVKNLGKSKSEKYLNTLIQYFGREENTNIKREIISSVGRMKSINAVPFLLDVLLDNDPKILSQSIRALLCFKGDNSVDKALIDLINHENEIIRSVIQKEYFNEKSSSKSKQSHVDTYDYLKNVVVNGDVLEILPLLQDESIHLTFTSPPYYNARDYSIYPSYEAYLNFLMEVFKETHRITKEGRYLIVNTSPVIIPRISRSHSSKRYPIPFDLHGILTNIGWEFIDDIVWMKPEYSVKNRIGGFQQHRKPLAYKPNSVTEYLMVYRKQTDRLLDWNIRQYPDTIVEKSKVSGEFETTNVWKICPKSDKVHSAVFPDELCKRVIEYYSYYGDLVFDPFAGSGTFGRTAKKMNRFFFMTEKEEKYFEYMKQQSSKDHDTDNFETKFLSVNEFKECIN